MSNGQILASNRAEVAPRAGVTSLVSAAPPKLAARLEPFDSYWQAPADVDSGYKSFSAYYRANYLARVPADRDAKILVISCGPGYLVDLLIESGYRNVLGIDSDPAKVEHAKRRRLPCETAEAFPFLSRHQTGEYDCIIPEQELNHLTMEETIAFLGLCRLALRPGGSVIVYAMNGANPLVGSENLAHNIDHFYNLTEYSIGQVLQLGGFGTSSRSHSSCTCSGKIRSITSGSASPRRSRRACGSSSGSTARRCASCRRKSRPQAVRPAAA